MVDVISGADLNRLRDDHPQILRTYLSVHIPEVLYVGTVTGAPTRGQQTISVIAVSGNLTDVWDARPWTTAFVGTTAGDDSISKRRVKVADIGANTLKFDENSVEWADGQVITCYRDYDLWARFPYIDPSTHVFYKDYDEVYTNQNANTVPMAIMGPHRAGFIDGPSVTFTLDGSGSYTTASGAVMATYAWASTGGVIANPAVATTTITFTAPGTYWVRLTVFDNNGMGNQTLRVIIVHDRGSNAPYVDWEFTNSPKGKWSDGGWDCGIKVRGDAGIDEFPDNALCIIWAETFWDGVEDYIGDGYNIIMVGYIDQESVTKEMDTGEVSFSISTIHNRMKNIKSFSVSLEYNQTPTTWYQHRDLTVGRAVLHVIVRHSTLFLMTDVLAPILTTNTQILKAIDDFTGGNLYDMIDGFTYQNGIFAHICCDKYGRVWIEQDFSMLDAATRATKDVAVTYTDQDRRGPADLDFIRNPEERVAHCVVSGTSFDGANATPVISQAPGEVPHPHGSGEVTFERLVLNNQAYGNMIAGRVIAIVNRKIQEVRVPLSGMWQFAIDIVPQLWHQLNLSATSNKRGIALVGKYHIREINTDIQQSIGASTVDIILEPESFGPDGVPGPYPEDYPWPDYPPPDFPPPPPWYWPEDDPPYAMRNYYWPAYFYAVGTWAQQIMHEPMDYVNDVRLLFSMSLGSKPMIVSDGYSIFWRATLAGLDYIQRHYIATGTGDSLYVDTVNDADVNTITLIDANRVAAIGWVSGTPNTVGLWDVNFSTGASTLIWSLTDADNDNIGVWSFTWRDTAGINVYTMFDIEKWDGAFVSIDIVIHNWTTGVTTVLTDVINPLDAQLDFLNGAYAPPSMVDDKLYVFYSPSYSGLGVGRKAYCIVIDPAAGTATPVTLTQTGGIATGNDITFREQSCVYYDLKRIYLVVQYWSSVGADPVYKLHYFNTVSNTFVPTSTTTYTLMERLIHSKHKGYAGSLDAFNIVVIRDLNTSDNMSVGVVPLSPSTPEYYNRVAIELNDDVARVYVHKDGKILGYKFPTGELQEWITNIAEPDAGVAPETQFLRVLGDKFLLINQREGGVYTVYLITTRSTP